MKKPYPENLIDAINRKLPGQERVEVDGMTPDRLAGLSYVLSLLDERTRRILALHYERGLTYREIGDLLGLSGSTVGQIAGRALRILGARHRRPYYADGLEACDGLRKDQEDREAKRKLAEDTGGLMTENEILAVSTEVFGTREGRCLRSAGIMTIGDLTEAVRDPAWYLGVDGIGQASAYRIECGLERWREDRIEASDPRYEEILAAREFVRSREDWPEWRTGPDRKESETRDARKDAKG